MTQLAIIKAILEQRKPVGAPKFHVHTIGLFSSVVRDDFTPANYINYRLRQKVDSVSRNGVKEKYYKAIEREVAYI